VLRSRDLPLVAAVLTAGYFVYMISPGLRMRFAPDDMQNLYWYWSRGAFEVVKSNLLVITDAYRPLGGAFYLPLFSWFGLDPLPYRVAIFGMLCAGAFLLYLLGRHLTGSRFGGGVAVLTGGFHASAAGAYLSTAVVYEVLCHLFIAGTLLFYIRIRQSGRVLSRVEAGVLIALSACALNAKEMGVLIAPALILYELLFHGRRWRSAGRSAIWPVALVSMLTAGYVVAKMAGNETLTRVPDYHPVFSLERYLETTRAYVAYILLQDSVSNWEAVGFWVLLFLTAALLRRREMLFGAAFAWIGFLPVNFIAVREGFVLHIPLIGLGMWGAGLVITLVDIPARRMRWTEDTRAQVMSIAYVSLLVAALYVHVDHARYVEGLLRNAQKENWEILSEFRTADLRFRPGESVLFRDTPFEDNFDVYFMAKLWARDPSVRVSITREFDKSIAGDGPGPFDREFRFDGTRLLQTK
jgi:hypothetical protein